MPCTIISERQITNDVPSILPTAVVLGRGTAPPVKDTIINNTIITFRGRGMDFWS